MRRDYTKFLYENSDTDRDLKKRLQRLSPERIRFIHADVIELYLEEKFDAIYLSNLIGYHGDADAEKTSILNRVSRFLNPNGIVYVTNGECIWPSFLTKCASKFRIDYDLTEATDYHTNSSLWLPQVLRKV